MIEHDLTNVLDLNKCVKSKVCNEFDGLWYDEPMFGRDGGIASTIL